MRHLYLTIDHDAGVVDLRTNDPSHLEVAAQAFHTFAFAASGDTEIRVPDRGGVTVLKVGDINSFNLLWEA